MMLGKDANQATLETLCDAKEFDGIGPCVTEIVRAGAITRELKEKEAAALAGVENQQSTQQVIAQPTPNKTPSGRKGKNKSKQ
jgi:hypothetical protein